MFSWTPVHLAYNYIAILHLTLLTLWVFLQHVMVCLWDGSLAKKVKSTGTQKQHYDDSRLP